VSTDDTQLPVSTNDQDNQLTENCENNTAASPEKPTDEIVTKAATTSTKPSSKEEDPISLEKGREEISTVFNDVLSEELKLHNYFLQYVMGNAPRSVPTPKEQSVTLGWLTKLFLTIQGQVSGGFATWRMLVCTVYYVVSTILSIPETNLRFGTISPL